MKESTWRRSWSTSLTRPPLQRSLHDRAARPVAVKDSRAGDAGELAAAFRRTAQSAACYPGGLHPSSGHFRPHDARLSIGAEHLVAVDDGLLHGMRSCWNDADHD